jgi:hypothetical protein
MTPEEFKEEVQSFADLYLSDYAQSFKIEFSVDDAGDGEVQSADILITMGNHTTWNLPITQDEDDEPVFPAGDDHTLPLTPESAYALLWFEAMGRLEEATYPKP